MNLFTRYSGFSLLLMAGSLMAGCAGSAPDFSDRTSGAFSKQNNLAQWLVADNSSAAVSSVAAPVCSSTVGHPPQGWAIDGGNWCVVSCPVLPEDKILNRWMQTHDGLRCYATDQKATSLVKTEFEKAQWNLEEQLLFKGFDRSFVSQTEWQCTEQEYQIDPESRQGFWIDLPQIGNRYRFYKDGSLMIARGGEPLRFAGSWLSQQSREVLRNDRELFRFAVNYGGGRFDEFKSATRKQVCRFVDEPGPRYSGL